MFACSDRFEAGTLSIPGAGTDKTPSTYFKTRRVT